MNTCIFGDSVVWGAWLASRVAWVNLLRDDLEQNFHFRHRVYDLGIDGDMSREILGRFDIEARFRKPEIIIIAIGVNDSVYRTTPDNPLVPIEEFEHNLYELFHKASQFTKHVIFVGLVKGDDALTTPLPVSTTGKFYTKANAKRYDAVIRQVAEQTGAIFVDVNAKLDDSDFVDGLHPNAKGHEKIYEEVRKGLEKILTN